MSGGARLLVFAKAPIPGAVKTRLIPRLGVQQAAELHCALLEHQLQQAVAAGVGEVELWCAPSCDDAFLAECAQRHGITLHLQQGVDLGARMATALGDALGRGERALLIGCDIPMLDAARLRQAAQQLETSDAVFIPTLDGGYGLIGLRRLEPRLFSDMPWGGDQVMALTRSRLVEAAMQWAELTAVWDVDRPEDLARLATLPGFAAYVV